MATRIMDEGGPIRYLYRETPDQEDDSGWRILAGDETDVYMAGKGNVQYVSLGAVRDAYGNFTWDEHFRGFRERGN